MSTSLAASRRRRVLVAAASALVAGAAMVGVIHARSGSAAPASPSGGAVALGTATIRRMDVTAIQRLPGTLGFASPGTVVDELPQSAASETPAQAHAAVDSAQRQLNAAQTALADLRSVDGVTIAQAHAALSRAQAQRTTDSQTLAADQSRAAADAAAQQRDCGTPPAATCAADQQAVAHDNQTVAADQQTVAHDSDAIVAAQNADALAGPHAAQAEDAQAAQVSAAQGALAAAQSQQAAALAGNATVITALPSAGQTIDRGQSLFSLGGRPVTLLIGDVPAYRTLQPGMTDGSDVAELEDNLNHLGAAQGLAVDGHWSDALTAAVRGWQATVGVPQTGVLDIGTVEFLPTPIRVTSQRVAVGAVVQTGAAILDDTSTSRVVTAQVPASQTGVAHVHDAVAVSLPDGKTVVHGHVESIDAASAQAENGQSVGQQAQQQNGAPQAQITITITLDDGSAVAGFDNAPVGVEVTTATAHGVLAVPVDALLALEGGGYALEVVHPGGANTTVPVTPGLFDQSAMVEVSGAGLTEGMTVVVPAA